MENLNKALEKLKCLYVQKLKNEINILKEFYSSNIDYDNAMEILNVMHKIAGTSGMYNLVNLSKICANAELYLDSVKNNEAKLNKKLVKTYLSDIIALIEKI